MNVTFAEYKQAVLEQLDCNYTPGTKVIIIANNSHFMIGDVVELKWVSEDDGSEYLAERVTDGRRWWVMLEDFEIIK